MTSHDTVRAIRWHGDALELLDQRVLPGIEQYLRYEQAKDVADAITDMVVRGAPAIGITAAYAIVLAAQAAQRQGAENWHEQLDDELQYLAQSRPTAVNLFWAIDRMRDCLQEKNIEALEQLAIRIHQEDFKANTTMGNFGAELIPQDTAVYTHCNTGSLATGGYGTALGVIRSAFQQGRIEHVYAGETRPWLQGARLTAWELMRDDIPVSLVVEGAAGQLLRDKNVSWIIVGADRICLNGDVANKIGTYNLAVLAKHHGIKFMVAAPTTTIDVKTKTGSDIPIEERGASEVTTLRDQQIAPDNCHAVNPVFDVTPAELIDCIVTERGCIMNPHTAAVESHMQELAQ